MIIANFQKLNYIFFDDENFFIMKGSQFLLYSALHLLTYFPTIFPQFPSVKLLQRRAILSSNRFSFRIRQRLGCKTDPYDGESLLVGE